ncbi:hypothetical protein, partial [[Clostridium] symbiosum]|uniref:hypothetical protein n=1 Tax=Clostridium symbiosum TaxID=1512 RepID=UPI00319EB37A
RKYWKSLRKLLKSKKKKRPRLRVRGLKSRISGARPTESMSLGVALLNDNAGFLLPLYPTNG